MNTTLSAADVVPTGFGSLHHQIGKLAEYVVTIRPGWDTVAVADALWLSRDRKPLHELASIATQVALDPRYSGPSIIHMVAFGVVELH